MGEDANEDQRIGHHPRPNRFPHAYYARPYAQVPVDVFVATFHPSRRRNLRLL